MAKSTGAAKAKLWTDAHANGAVPSTPPLRKEMELFNSELGRGLPARRTRFRRRSAMAAEGGSLAFQAEGSVLEVLLGHISLWTAYHLT